jgi:hypothetical protein
MRLNTSLCNPVTCLCKPVRSRAYRWMEAPCPIHVTANYEQEVDGEQMQGLFVVVLQGT